MRFSILIPVYNGERYLRGCLDSVAAQTCDDYEALVIDDGSTDGSGAIMDAYAEAHANMRVLRGPNEGLLLARRRGLSIAQGQYVVFLDCDDLLVPGALATISDAIDANGADIVMYGFSRREDLEPTTAKASRLAPGLYDGERYSEVKDYAIRGYMSSMWMKAVRKPCFDLEDDYDSFAGLMHGEDLLQTLPIVNRAKSLEMLDSVLYYYRPNDASSTARYKSGQLEDIIRVNERLLDYGRRWGDECYASALVGEAIQYVNLLTIIALSGAPKDEMLLDCEQVRNGMERQGAFARAKEASLRFDHRLELRSLESGRYLRALRTIRGVQAAKSLPGAR